MVRPSSFIHNNMIILAGWSDCYLIHNDMIILVGWSDLYHFIHNNMILLIACRLPSPPCRHRSGVLECGRQDACWDSGRLQTQEQAYSYDPALPGHTATTSDGHGGRGTTPTRAQVNNRGLIQYKDDILPV